MAGYTCGDNYEGAMGTIHSENFPNNYDNDMICLYTITVPDGVVLLNFTEIDVQMEERCFNDAITVRLRTLKKKEWLMFRLNSV